MVVKGIVLHLTASRFGDVAQVDQWHKQRGFSGIGYHRLILNGVRNAGDAYNENLDGQIQTGRADNVMGAHCKAEGMNVCTLGISCVGDPNSVPHGADKAPGDITAKPYMTAKQFRSVVNAAARLCLRFHLDPAGTFRHPGTGKTHAVITQHSQHDPGKPFCASLQIERMRKAIVDEVARLREAGLGMIGDDDANEAENPEAIEATLPEFNQNGSPDGPDDPETDAPHPQ